MKLKGETTLVQKWSLAIWKKAAKCWAENATRASLRFSYTSLESCKIRVLTDLHTLGVESRFGKGNYAQSTKLLLQQLVKLGFFESIIDLASHDAVFLFLPPFPNPS